MTSHGELAGATNAGSIRSGHYMVSQLDDDSEEEEPDLPRTIVDHQHNAVAELDAVWQPRQPKNGDKEQPFLFTAAKKKNSVMDINQLARLFDCLSVYSDQLTTPRWNHFRGLRLSRTDRIRLNNLIWREFYTQIVSQKKPIFVKFEAPTLENHLRPKSVIIEGKYWKRRFDSVCLEYLRWRCFYKLRLGGVGFPLSMTDEELLDQVSLNQQGYLSNDGFSCNAMDATDDLLSDLVNNLDWLLDASATTAGGLPTTSATSHSDPSLTFPELSRDFGQVNNNADIMQPLLLQMASNVDDSAVDFLANLIPTSAPSPYPSHWGASGGDLPVSMSSSAQGQQEVVLSCPYPMSISPFQQPQSVMQVPPMKNSLHGEAQTSSFIVFGSSEQQNQQQHFQKQHNYQQPRQTHQQLHQNHQQLTQRQAARQTHQQPRQTHQQLHQNHQQLTQPQAARQTHQQSQQPQHTQQPQSQKHRQQSQQDYQQPRPNCQQQASEHLVGYKQNPFSDQSGSKLLQRSSDSPEETQVSQQSIDLCNAGAAQPQVASTTLLVTFGNQASPSSDVVPSRTAARGTTARQEPYPRRRKKSALMRFARPTPIAPKPHTSDLPRRTAALASLVVPTAPPVAKIDPPGATCEADDCFRLLDNINKRLNLQRCERRWPSASDLGTDTFNHFGGSTGQMRSPGSFPDVSNSFSISPLPPPALPGSTRGPSLPTRGPSLPTRATSQPTRDPSQPTRGPSQPSIRVAEPEPTKGEVTPEVRRRSDINLGLEKLHSLLPDNVCSSPGTKALTMPKAMVLLRSSAYIRKLRKERDTFEEECRILRLEAECLQNEINACCAKLPETGLATPHIASDKGERWFRAYIQASTLRNWKFYIFSLIAEKLFSAYTSLVSMNSVQDFTVSAMTWLEQYCSMTSLRNFVTVALRKLSIRTSVLTDTSQLPQEALKAVSEAPKVTDPH